MYLKLESVFFVNNFVIKSNFVELLIIYLELGIIVLNNEM